MVADKTRCYFSSQILSSYHILGWMWFWRMNSLKYKSCLCTEVYIKYIQTYTRIHVHRFCLSIHDGGFLIRKKAGLVLISLLYPTKMVSHHLKTACKVRMQSVALFGCRRKNSVHTCSFFFSFFKWNIHNSSVELKITAEEWSVKSQKIAGGK